MCSNAGRISTEMMWIQYIVGVRVKCKFTKKKHASHWQGERIMRKTLMNERHLEKKLHNAKKITKKEHVANRQVIQNVTMKLTPSIYIYI